MRIPFSGVGYRYETDDIEVVATAMAAEDTLTQGQYLRRFETAFSDLMGGGQSYAVSNAASAIDLVARCLDLKPGDEIIAPAHTYTASVYPFLRSGSSVVWADIHPEELVLTVETIESLITERTRVVVAVDLYGLPVDIEPIAALCRDRGIFLLSDSSQALGALNADGTPVGTKSDAAVFSFQSHKNVSTLGEGGMLWFSDESPLSSSVRLLRHNGHKAFDTNREHYWFPAMVDVVLESPDMLPLNYCLGEAQCALGAHLLGKMPRITAERRLRYLEALDHLQGTGISLQAWTDERSSSHHLLPLRLSWSKSHEQTNDFMRQLVSHGINPAKQYFPLNQYSFYKDLGFGSAVVPESEKFYMQQVSLPFHSWMSDSDFSWMMRAIKILAGENRGRI